MNREYSNGRERRKRKGKGLVIGILLIILGGLALFVFTAKDKAENEKRFTFECNAERVEFLNSFGLIVEPEPETEDILIPAEFTPSYTEYNELQKAQGFDLLPYSGKDVTLYRYRILNYPEIPENITVNLLFDDHLLIGADITFNDAEKGFTKPLIAETMQSSLNLDVK